MRYLILFCATLLASPLLPRDNFRTTTSHFEETRLGPVLARAAYVQTYQAYTGQPMFRPVYDSLDLLVAFRGDVRLFAVFHNGKPLVVGARSHRPDAMMAAPWGLLREIALFDVDLEKREYHEKFYLLEDGQVAAESHINNDQCALLDSGQAQSECELPVILQDWLEYLRHSRGLTDAPDDATRIRDHQ